MIYFFRYNLEMKVQLLKPFYIEITLLFHRYLQLHKTASDHVAKCYKGYMSEQHHFRAEPGLRVPYRAWEKTGASSLTLAMRMRTDAVPVRGGCPLSTAITTNSYMWLARSKFSLWLELTTP